MKWARISGNKVIEIFDFDPNKWIKNDDFLRHCQLVPDNVKQNWVIENNVWISVENLNHRKEKEEEIIRLKEQLNATDYKVIKASEYKLVGVECEYDIQDIHKERQKLRDKINKLEAELEV